MLEQKLIGYTTFYFSLVILKRLTQLFCSMAFDCPALLMFLGWNTGTIWIGGKISFLGFWQWHGNSTRHIDALPWGPDEPNGSGSNRCIACTSGEDFFYDDGPCTIAHYFACELTK